MEVNGRNKDDFALAIFVGIIHGADTSGPLAEDFFPQHQEAERAFRGPPQNRITSWVTVKFRLGTRLLSQLVSRTKRFVRSYSITCPTRIKSNTYTSCPVALCAPRLGEPFSSLPCLLSSGYHSFSRVPGKLKHLQLYSLFKCS